MADLTIFQLTQILPAAVVGADDLVPLWDNSATETKKITVDDLKTVLGGLVDWTDNFSSATQATSQFAATNAAANVNAAITPKGTGALLVDMPDGTATGGNARGASAVDLQHSRLSATQVASGVASTIVGGVQNTNGSAYGVVGGIGNNAPNGNYATIFGYNNSLGNFLDAPTISGGRNHTVGVTYGVVGGGFGNTITAGQSSVIAGGASNTINTAATGLAFIGGGTTNSVTGTYSNIVGGDSNTTSSPWSSIVGGQQNTMTSQWGFIGGGFSNNASGNGLVIVGGYDHTLIGSYGFIGGGEQNNYSAGSYGVIVGGQLNTLSANWGFLGGGFTNSLNEQFTSIVGGRNANATLYGMQAYSAGQFSAQADAQMATIQMRALVTGTGIADLFLDGASIRPILPATNTLWAVRVQIVAICTNVGGGSTLVLGASFAAERQCAIKRLGTATALVGAVQTIGANLSDTTMSTSAVTITADDTNEALRIQFTPPTTAGASSTIRVVATIQLTQVKY